MDDSNNKKALTIIILIFILMFIFWPRNEKSKEDYIFKVNLEKEPYKICGTDIYFSNSAYGQELKMSDIIDTISETCEVNKLENAKDNIESILNDPDLTKEDILRRLRNTYYYLN